MKEFYPWATTTNETAVGKYVNGSFSILDIQLSGICNYNCIYCDSPDRNQHSKIDFVHLEHLIQKEKGIYDLMFVCGAGEPTFGKNKTIFLELLSLCKANNIKCSFFTNGSNLSNEILDYISDDILFPLIKNDTFSLEKAKEIYQSKEVQKTFNAINSIFEIAKQKKSNDFYSVAISIVPTKKNYSEIPFIIEKCIKNDTFPLLANLEFAGNAKEKYNELCLTREELINIKNEISNILGNDYVIPTCPSVISGIHIGNDSFISVDKKTGLSCDWFWLKEPEIEKLASINNIESLKDAGKNILYYRKRIIQGILDLPLQVEKPLLGGCGGNLKNILSDYISISKKMFNK